MKALLQKLGRLSIGLTLLAACGGPSPANTAPSESNPDSTSEDSLSDDDETEAVAQGEAALKAEDFAKAKGIFQKIVDRKPNHAKATHYLAVSLEALGDIEGAEKYYRKAISISPAHADSAMNLSAMLIETKRYNEAEQILAASTKRNPKDPVLLINLGYAQLAQSKTAAARDSFNAALALADSIDVRFGLAKLEIVNGTPKDAIAHLRSARDRADNEIGSLVRCADLFREAGAPELCVETLDSAIKIETSPELYVRRGACKQVASPRTAKADYEKAISINPNYARAYFALGNFLLTVEKNKKAAIEAFETCARLNPESKCKESADKARK